MANETANKPQVKKAGERWAIAFAWASAVLLLLVLATMAFFAFGGLRYVRHRIVYIGEKPIADFEVGTFIKYDSHDKSYNVDDIIVFAYEKELYVGQIELIDQTAQLIRVVSDGTANITFNDVDGVFEKELKTLTAFVNFCSSEGGKVAMALASVLVVVVALAMSIASNEIQVQNAIASRAGKVNTMKENRQKEKSLK